MKRTQTTKWPLKTWDGDSSGWCQPLSESTTVCMTDEAVRLDAPHRLGYVKPRFFLLAQTGNTPAVHTGLPGKHLLLSEAEARELLEHLLNSFEALDVDAAAARKVPPKKRKDASTRKRRLIGSK